MRMSLFEYACHEGNYSIVNMLSGAPAEESIANEERELRADAPDAPVTRSCPRWALVDQASRERLDQAVHALGHLAQDRPAVGAGDKGPIEQVREQNSLQYPAERRVRASVVVKTMTAIRGSNATVTDLATTGRSAATLWTSGKPSPPRPPATWFPWGASAPASRVQAGKRTARTLTTADDQLFDSARS